MSKSISRRWRTALIAPAAFGLFAMGDVNQADAGHAVHCPPASPQPCLSCDEHVPTPCGPMEVVPPAPIEFDASEVPTEPGVAESVPEPMAETFQDFTTPPPSMDLSTGLASSFGSGGAGSLAFADAIVAPGYIDSAIIQSRVRVRYDDLVSDSNQLGRAGFLYPALNTGNNYSGGRGPDGIGGIGLGASGELDIEQLSTYVELAFRDRFSIFVDVPIRWIGPLGLGAPFTDGTQRGAGDISTGFRWGWIADPDEHLTLQVRTTLPTGEARRALGTGNTSIDVGLLYDVQCGSSTRLFAEINDWQTLDAVTLTDTSGGTLPVEVLNQDANILRGGLGVGVDFWKNCSRCEPRTATFLFECVGWTVLDGVNVPLDANDPTDAEGDTIVNGKYGVRFSGTKNSMYVGYGHSWTGDFWYSDLLRLEYQYNF